ncbi:hypothetical protein ASZ90_009198 [hydrocarbon metagenome]|uniref:Uncharacterized protein n=1 Tax=hydrocarbon metagenome TaxID=938273 RepID=A0A0W8FJL8_9ZZZZ
MRIFGAPMKYIGNDEDIVSDLHTPCSGYGCNLKMLKYIIAGMVYFAGDK